MRKISSFFRCLLALLLFFSACEYSRAANLGDAVFREDFQSADALKKWQNATPQTQIVDGENGNRALQIERSEGASQMVSLELPVKELRGVTLRIVSRIKAENISAPPKPWNGIKVLLHIETSTGDSWPQQPLETGSFDWKSVRFTAGVPENTTKITLLLGLEEVTGRATFDDIAISILKMPRARPKTPPTGAKFRGHNLPRLRGVMIDPNLKESDLRVLASWNVNLVRWQLTWNGFPASPADDGDLAAYDAWLESALKKVDEMLPLCRKLGIRVALDLHTLPGGVNAKTSQTNIFAEKRFQEKFLQVWEKMARRYKGESALWGFDLANEPIEGDIPDELLDWHDLATAAAKRIRAIDPQRTLIVEAPPGGGPDALANFTPLPLPRVVYSFHMYEPHQFTHQGVLPGLPVGVKYPGEIGGKLWDKAALRRALAPVIAWQRDYNVQLYVGEFSAVRWAPGARDYLRDVIDIFEENGWDWSYHAFREWPGWSVEYSDLQSDEKPAAIPTSREVLLRSWFAKNKRPPIVASTRKR